VREHLNIILITVDSLRFDDFMAFAKKTLSLMLKSGQIFVNAVAAGPSTSPSILAMLTSELPLEYGNYFFVSPRRISLASVLRIHGYKCLCLQTNYFLRRKFGWAKGFHIYEELFPSKPVLKRAIERLIRIGLLRSLLKIMDFTGRMTLRKPICRADEVFREALKFVSKIEKPFFLWIHLMDVHAPFIPNEDSYKQFVGSVSYARVLNANLTWIYRPQELKREDINLLRALYRAEIISLDEKLYQFLTRLLELFKSSDLCIVVTADHGEEFWDHGGYNHEAKLYDELIHIPLLLMAPDLPSGIIIEEPVSLMDLAPTLASLALKRKTAVPKWKGVNIVEILEGEGLRPDGPGVLSEVAHREPWKINIEALKVSARSKRWKVIYDAEKKSYEVYDLTSDPMELKNIGSKCLGDQELKTLRSTVWKRVMSLRIRFKIRKRLGSLARAQVGRTSPCP